MKREKNNHGFSIIEVVITVSIFLIVILGLVGGLSVAIRHSLENVTKIQASFLEEEGLEAVRLLRDASWTANIAVHTSGAPFYLYFNGVQWSATTTNVLMASIFERRIILNDVYRDASQNITISGGTLDPNIKKVTSEVSWAAGAATTTRSLSTYITNIFEN